MLCAGGLLGPSADKPVHDLRKPLIIMGTMAAFLAFWGVALWRRARASQNLVNAESRPMLGSDRPALVGPAGSR